MNHHHHEHRATISPYRLAASATTHCLVGCGLGEVSGMIIGTALHMSNAASIILAVILGFIGGLGLGVVPWLKIGLTLAGAVKKVVYVEGLSILVMEAAEVTTEIYTPGVMTAHINQPIFWVGMLLALSAGWLAAFPVNFVLAKRGVTHAH
jgi:hypothetical protein